jgi:hypothetical protein
MYEPNEDEIPGQAKLRHLFGETLLAIQTLFADISKTDRWSNRADFYSLFVGLGSLLDKNELPKGAKLRTMRTDLETFAADVSACLEDGQTSNVISGVRKYARAIEKGSNDKARRLARHEAIVGLVKPFLTER